jgi:hypothetical protein
VYLNEFLFFRFQSIKCIDIIVSFLSDYSHSSPSGLQAVDGLPVTSHSSSFGEAVYAERCLLMKEARLHLELGLSHGSLRSKTSIDGAHQRLVP